MPRDPSANQKLSKDVVKRHGLSVSNIRLPWLIFTLIIFSGLLTLGFWQIDRAIEKEQRLARINQLSQQKALSLGQVLALNKQRNQQSNLLTTDRNSIDKEYFNDFPISVSAEFDPRHVFLLDNQVNQGKTGYRVLQLATVDNYALLINLGWVVGSVQRNILPEIVSLTGKHQFNANMRFPEMGVMLMEQDFTQATWPLRVQQIELDKFSQLIGQKLLPFVAYLDKNEQIGFVKNWQPIVMPPEKHRGYAFQWFSLATAWILLMLWAAFRSKAEPKKHNNSQG